MPGPREVKEMAEREERAGPMDPARDNEENELQAEEDSAQAMDAEVSHGEDESDTTEGQPS
jgi:hypothetical protein